MESYSDVSERKLIIQLFSAIGAVTTAFMAMFALYEQQWLLMGGLLLAAILFFVPVLTKQRTDISSVFILYTLYCLMLYLTLTGGVNGTGPLWIFIAAPVTFFIQGLKRGIIHIGGFIIAILGAFIVSKQFSIYPYYDWYFPSRVIISFLIVSILSGLYEFFRENYTKKLILLAKNNEWLANQDPLTRLANRRSAMRKLQKLEQNSLSDEIDACILLIDVDDFKLINDQFGHQQGDKALKYLADILSKQTKADDLVARWGGEEFLVVMPNCNLETAKRVAVQIHQALNRSHYEIGKLELTVSIGIASYDKSKSIDLLIHEADKNLYLAKNNGKNQTHPS